MYLTSTTQSFNIKDERAVLLQQSVKCVPLQPIRDHRPSLMDIREKGLRMRTSGWDYEKRIQLEQIMSKGHTMAQAASMLGKCYQTIRSEIVRGCTDDEYKEKRYSQYKATRATLTELFEDVPEDEIRKALKELQSEARRL